MADGKIANWWIKMKSDDNSLKKSYVIFIIPVILLVSLLQKFNVFGVVELGNLKSSLKHSIEDALNRIKLNKYADDQL